MKCKHCGWDIHYGDKCENLGDSPFGPRTRPSGCYEREIALLRKALEFYAKEETYNAGTRPERITHDLGDIARKALEVPDAYRT